MISWPAANGMAASRAVPMQTDAPSGTTRAIASRSETSLEADTPLNSTGSAGVFKRVGAARQGFRILTEKARNSSTSGLLRFEGAIAAYRARGGRARISGGTA